MKLLVAMALGILVYNASAQEDARHNVLVILADDLGAECLGCYGGTSYPTPELDRLAAAGVRFAQGHTQPLCTPTRVEIMTGLSNARNYVAFSVLPPGSRTFAHLLGDAGYDTGVFGKWQLYAAEHYPESLRGTGTLPEDAGFEQHCLWQVDVLGSRYWSPRLRINGETQQFDEDIYGPDVCAEWLMEFIGTERDRPFLAYWPMALPHSPFVPPPPKPDAFKKGAKHFAAMVTYMDTLVGRVVRHIEKLGLAERTLVLSGWPRELTQLERELSAAHGRGVYVVLFSHAALPSSLAGVHFSYALPEESLEQFWQHRLVAVADDVHTLIGATEKRERDMAVVSQTPAIAQFAVGQVALDITLLAQRHGHDVGDVMVKILGDRVGRLDMLLTDDVAPELGVEHRCASATGKRKKKRGAPRKRR